MAWKPFSFSELSEESLTVRVLEVEVMTGGMESPQYLPRLGELAVGPSYTFGGESVDIV